MNIEIKQAYAFIKTLQPKEWKVVSKDSTSLLKGQFSSCKKEMPVSDINNLLYINDKDDGSVSKDFMGFVVDVSNFYLSETKDDDIINLRSVVNEGGEYTFSK